MNIINNSSYFSIIDRGHIGKKMLVGGAILAVSAISLYGMYQYFSSPSDPSILSKKHISYLGDVSKISKEEWQAFASLSEEDKRWIAQQFDSKEVQSLLSAIDTRRINLCGAREGYDRNIFSYDSNVHALYQAIHVVLGVKPVLVVEKGHLSDRYMKPLTELAKNNPNIKFFIDHEGDFHLINEKPLKAFDPRNYLECLFEESELTPTYFYAWEKRRTAEGDQLLSYFLGYGPSWESFVNNLPKERENKTRCFREAHFKELGMSLNPQATEQEAVHIGLSYSCTFSHLIEPLQFVKEYHISSVVFDNLGIEQMADGIVIRSPYFQYAYALKKEIYNQTEVHLKRKAERGREKEEI